MLERLRHEPERVAGYLALAAWVVLPLTLGPLLGDALDPTRDRFRTVSSWGLWAGWLGVLICLSAPRPATLTIGRIAGLAAVPAAVWAALESDDRGSAGAGLLSAIVVAALLLQPALADRFVDGVSYGSERRFVLRPPGPVLLGLLVPTWAVTVAGLTAGPLLLLDERWTAGAVLIVVGYPLAFVASRALHQLTRRFLVFVPNGVVVHDATVLREPVLFTSREIAGIGPALAETTATDLTSAALGLALELRLAAPASVALVTGRTTTEEHDIRALLVAPSRPAAVLRLARERGLRIA